MQTILIPHILEIPPGFPPGVRRSLAGRRVAFDLPRQLKLRMRHPEKMRVSEWAEKYRIVTDGAHEGPWRHDYAPHTVKIMDTFGLAWVREIWFCGVEQSGKTNTMLNCIGWAVDCDPGNIFYLMPTEDTAAKITGGKLKPTLAKSPRLARYVSARQDDTTLSRINLQHGVTIFPAHANSASSMATWAAKHCFGDEVDKYPPMAGKEADPITLIKKRNRTYKGRYKRFFASTPAGLFIYKGMQNCHQVWEYRLKCPHCGELVRMDAEHLILPPASDGTTPTPEDAERLGVAYECNACGELWDDTAREAAIRSGRWHCVKGADVHRPAKVGFHHRAWECLDITLSEIAAAWLRAQQGDLAAKVAWANGYEAVDYVAEATGSVEPEHLLKFRSDLPRNLVPPDTARLCLLADTQQASFYYQVWAYGYAPEVTMHLVRHGIVERFADLEGMFQEVYTDHNGTEHRIANGLIDSGGTRRGWQKHSRTVEVYEWCSRNRSMIPIKGLPGRTGETVTWKQVETFPGTNKRIPGGLKRANIRVDLFKDELERRLHQEPDDPGAISFHSEIDEPFARHYSGETKDEQGDWQHNRKQRIDYWDCTVYALALREMMKLRMPRNPTEAQPAQRRIISKGVRHE